MPVLRGGECIVPCIAVHVSEGVVSRRRGVGKGQRSKVVSTASVVPIGRSITPWNPCLLLLPRLPFVPGLIRRIDTLPPRSLRLLRILRLLLLLLLLLLLDALR